MSSCEDESGSCAKKNEWGGKDIYRKFEIGNKNLRNGMKENICNFTKFECLYQKPGDNHQPPYISRLTKTYIIYYLTSSISYIPLHYIKNIYIEYIFIKPEHIKL